MTCTIPATLHYTTPPHHHHPRSRFSSTPSQDRSFSVPTADFEILISALLLLRMGSKFGWRQVQSQRARCSLRCPGCLYISLILPREGERFEPRQTSNSKMENTIEVLQLVLSQEVNLRRSYEALCDALRNQSRTLESECISLQALLHEEKMRNLALSHLVSASFPKPVQPLTQITEGGFSDHLSRSINPGIYTWHGYRDETK